MDEPFASLILLSALSLALPVSIVVLARFAVIAPPNKILVLSGRRQSRRGEPDRGYRLLREGWSIRIPFLEIVHTLRTTVLLAKVELDEVQAADEASLRIYVDFCLSIDGASKNTHNAVEAFLGRDKSEVIAIATDILAGQIRALAASMEAGPLSEDRDAFARRLEEVVQPELENVGLLLRGILPQEIELLSVPENTLTSQEFQSLV